MNTDFFGPSAERNSWFGGLNAGVKLVVAGVLVLAAILIQDPVTAAIIFGLELLGFIAVGFRPVNLLARSWPILIAVLTTGWSVAILVNKTGAVLLDFGLNTITEGSLAAAFSMMIRSLAMILPTFAFVLSTDPTDLGDSLAQTFRLPARFVLAALAALRLVGIRWGRHGVHAGWARVRARSGASKPVPGRPSRSWYRQFAAVRALRSQWRRAVSAPANVPGHACRPIPGVMRMLRLPPP